MVNEKLLGVYDEQTTAIIIDNLISRENRKLVVKPIRSSNPELWIGQHTVAVFRIRKAVKEPAPSKVDIPGNVTGLFISHFNKQDMKRKSMLYRDPGVPGSEGGEVEATQETAGAETVTTEGEGGEAVAAD